MSCKLCGAPDGAEHNPECERAGEITDTQPAPTPLTFAEILDRLEAIAGEKAAKRAAAIAAGDKKPRQFEQDEYERDELIGAALIAGGRYAIRLTDALEQIAAELAKAGKR